MKPPGYEGPARPRILCLGEAWGEQEAMMQRPFVGASGQELWRLLGEAMPGAEGPHLTAGEKHRFGAAWIQHRHEWLAQQRVGFANVLNLRPPDNKLEHLCSPKDEAGKDYPWPALAQGKYLRRDLASHAMEDLGLLLAWAKPNLVVALGNTACWAMLGMTNIGSIRGTIFRGLGDVKVLPTYHPAAVLRQWSWRTIVLADLMKARREAEFPEVRRPERQVLVNPTGAELAWGAEKVLTEALGSGVLANDVETKNRQITCISFAGSAKFALTIPFYDPTKRGGSYWETAEQEGKAWRLVKTLLEDPRFEKLGQNYIYDLQYLTTMGIAPKRVVRDTMLLHHAWFPELQKGLGFLGSIYTSEPAWKLMRRQRKADKMEKRDE